MKKLLTLFISVLCALGALAEDFEVDSIYYNILADKTNEVEVTFRGTNYYGSESYGGSVTIPALVIYNDTTYNVTRIGSNAFYRCSGLSSVTIPNGVTSIDESAFYGCSTLTSVTIPNSVTNVGDYAFSYCSSLTSPIYNEHCFACLPMSYSGVYTIPDGIKQIAGGALLKCSDLTSITIPNSVTSIGASAFAMCTKLTSVVIPDGVTSIGMRAFSGCSGLTSVTIPNSVTSIGYSAFTSCSNLTSPIYNAHCFACLPESYSGTYAVPDGIEQIAGGAFGSCRKLTSVTIPNSVTYIGSNAFSMCSSLTSPVYNAHCFAYLPANYSETYIIPDGIKQIAGAAFYYCYGLTSVTIPNSVTSIDESAFYGCTDLRSIESFAKVPPTILGTNVFRDVSTDIPIYVLCGKEEIYQAADGWNSFSNIQGILSEYSILVDVNDDNMGTAVVDFSFCEESQISATPNYGYYFVRWSDGNTDNPRSLVLTQDTVLVAEFARAYSGQCGDELYWLFNNDTLTITGSGTMWDNRPWGLLIDEIQHVALPLGITHIGNDAFANCVNLRKIDIPYSVTSIGENCFAGCRNLFDIYCYPLTPPSAETNSFANYNVYLYAPCDNLRDYQMDMVFGSFKYFQCISSEEVATDSVIVSAGSTEVTIVWPTEEDANTYTIVIKKSNEVVCTLTFDKDGRLTNIAFAPGRDGNRPVQCAKQVNNGFSFTVTGLESATHYAFDLAVKDASDVTIQSYSDEFTTNAPTAVENTHGQSSITNYQKLIRDGQFLILYDGKTYNAMGIQVK